MHLVSLILHFSGAKDSGGFDLVTLPSSQMCLKCIPCSFMTSVFYFSLCLQWKCRIVGGISTENPNILAGFPLLLRIQICRIVACIWALQNFFS
uniref:Uncharacterized protein n=1 Tax=Nelumbo nucifera TaxID=4432 RepID=A0A823A2E7_NELNU|nr:TPA_asm: hypothetical protein HUJ06_019044 [Nelumbo nucifera]